MGQAIAGQRAPIFAKRDVDPGVAQWFLPCVPDGKGHDIRNGSAGERRRLPALPFPTGFPTASGVPTRWPQISWTRRAFL